MIDFIVFGNNNHHASSFYQLHLLRMIIYGNLELWLGPRRIWARLVYWNIRDRSPAKMWRLWKKKLCITRSTKEAGLPHRIESKNGTSWGGKIQRCKYGHKSRVAFKVVMGRAKARSRKKKNYWISKMPLQKKNYNFVFWYCLLVENLQLFDWILYKNHCK